MTLFSGDCDYKAAFRALKEVCGFDNQRTYNLLRDVQRIITYYDGRIFLQYHRETDSFYLQIC